jgi:hypothetical protein
MVICPIPILSLAVLMPEWQLHEYTVSSALQDREEWSCTNSADEPLTNMTVNWTDAKVQNVTGSTNTEPPWSSKFTPLQTVSVPVSEAIYPQTIPAKKKYTRILRFSRETGHEIWKDVTDPELQPQFRRDRTWDGPHSIFWDIEDVP